MIKHFLSFEVNGTTDIPNCEVDIGSNIKIHAAIENDKPEWVHITEIVIHVWKLENGSWNWFGHFKWIGSCALKPDQMYDLQAKNGFIANHSGYHLSPAMFKYGDKTGTIYYCPRLELSFSR